METRIFPEVPANELEDYLIANAIGTKEENVERHFTPEQMEQFRTDYFKNVLTIRKAIAELNAAKKRYAEATKDAVEQNKVYVENLQHGFQSVPAQVYLFPDNESRMIGTYDNQGMLLHSRRMLPDEQQLYIRRDNVQV